MKREQRDGYTLWTETRPAPGLPGQSLEIRFVGRGRNKKDSREKVLEHVEPAAPPLSGARQIHSDRVLEARPGRCGSGDALVTDRDDLTLSVITADCVPVLLAGPGGLLGAVHAGWRGAAARIVDRAVERLLALPDGGVSPSDLTAWVGPAIGGCCYEVGDDVAEAVASVSHPDVVIAGMGRDGRPHLDVGRAVVHQLEALGVGEVVTLDGVCTHCDTRELYSYRRNGKFAGRNVAYLWRREMG